MEAVWIDAASRDHAQALGYTVVDPSTVIATHLSFVIQAHANEILGHEEVQQLLNGLAKSAPKLVEDLVPRVLPLSTVVRVLQSLLAERIPIRNIRTIIETLAEHAPRSQDAAVLLSHVRMALGRQIVQDIAGIARSCPSSPSSRISSGCSPARSPPAPRARASSPGWRSGCSSASARHRGARRPRARPPVLLVPPPLRAHLARFLRAALPELHVLAWNEIPDNRKVRVVTAVGR